MREDDSERASQGLARKRADPHKGPEARNERGVEQ
ncbi:MAG: hypothetical protein QOF87_2846 [Pseudonocardiales bacterium]|jgi:hypothetical protein|nr:hypothetical protein [Pseudonocardiales bacterium]MDT4975312.1 hypothetical protein [Pseudonocardiales bacterium]